MKSTVMKFIVLFQTARYPNRWKIMSEHHKSPMNNFSPTLKSIYFVHQNQCRFWAFLFFVQSVINIRIHNVFLNFSIVDGTLQAAQKVKQMQLNENTDYFNSFKVNLLGTLSLKSFPLDYMTKIDVQINLYQQRG